MCRDCGCGEGNWHQHEDGTWHSHDHKQTHDHDHTKDHSHHHHHDDDSNHHHHHHHHHHDDHDHQSGSDTPHASKIPSDSVASSVSNSKVKSDKVQIETRQAVLAKNDEIAQNNRTWFLKNKILCLNFISSPGTGKTALLEKLIELLSQKHKVSVLVGDQATNLDALRLNDKGAQVKQINTHSSCHLDAPHIESQLGTFVSPQTEILIIENVGNLVCPSAFDLGEAAKVALLSCTEGEEKPLKYPVIFSQAQAIVLTKMDLEPHLKWSLAKAKENIRRMNSLAPIIQTSSETGKGLEELVNWIESSYQKVIDRDLEK